jgi:CheY-like chemotaxis protein
LIGLPAADAHRLASGFRKTMISRRARIIASFLFESKDRREDTRKYHYFMITADEENRLAAIEKEPREWDAAPLSSLPPRGEGRPRLLLIEDNVELAQVTAEFLGDAELEVRIAESGEEALAIARAFRPEIILCDMTLRDMSGLDVAGAFRANPDMKHVLFALHSALSDVELRALEREIDADEINLFLSKPLTQQKIDRLLAALEVMRKSAQSQRERRTG